MEMPQLRTKNHHYQYPRSRPHYKRIIVCCDGTWLNSNKITDIDYSNVTRLCRALKSSDRSISNIKQVTYYQNGIASIGSKYMPSRLWAAAFGVGLEENIREAYIFIASNYEPGDELFFFGFSRGAYTARAVAALIGEIGILFKDNGLEQLSVIYGELSKEGNDKKGLEEFRNHFKQLVKDKKIFTHLNVPIEGVGVWDTVGERGIPRGVIEDITQWNKRYRFIDTKLGFGVKHAFQALALDEHRRAYLPTLWHLPHPRPADAPEAPELVQCWFPGSHSDIGGGVAGNDHHPAFADLTLSWMVDHFSRPRGALGHPLLSFDKKYLEKEILIIPNSDKKSRQESKSRWWKTQTSVSYAYAKIWDSAESTTYFLGFGSKYRYPGRVKSRDTGKTNEFIHSTVRLRIDRGFDPKYPGWKDYKPKGLKGFVFEMFSRQNREKANGRPSRRATSRRSGIIGVWKKGNLIVPEEVPVKRTYQWRKIGNEDLTFLGYENGTANGF